MKRAVPTISWGPRHVRRARVAVMVIAALVVVSQWLRCFGRQAYSDFALHWAFGSRFLAGTYLYEIGHIPYPPFWGMACAPLALLPVHWAHVVTYPLGILALGTLILVLDRLSRRSLPLDNPRLFWSTALALALSSRFLIRELPESGPNLLMVALAWGGIALWRQGRDGVGGACLGLAIALKCTQGLFLPYLVLKRQWRMAAAATAFTVLFTVAPVVRQGPALYARHLRTWTANCWAGLTGTLLTVVVPGQEEVKNVALKPTLGRFLMHLPPGHKGLIASSWRAEWLDLPLPVADAVVNLVVLLLTAGIAWRFRRPAHQRGEESILWEGATVSLLILLFSPISWRQHCVAVFPALYLITRTVVARGRLPRWMLGALGAYVVLVLVLDRGVVGRDLTMILDSFGATTWSLLLVLAVTLGCHARTRPEARSMGRPHVVGSPATRVGTVTSASGQA
jgi:hypothetical protein